MKKLAAAIISVLAFGGAFAEEKTITDDYSMSSAQTLTVPEGDVYTYTGKFTGTKKTLSLKGGGTAILTNTENTWTSAFYIYNGTLRMDVAQALSTTDGIIVYPTNENTRVEFTHEGGVYNCPFKMASVTPVTSPFVIKANCTINGDITPLGSKAWSITGSAGKSATFNGAVTIKDKNLSMYPEAGGKFVFNGPISVTSGKEGYLMTTGGDGHGTIELAGNNDISTAVYFGYHTLVLSHENALETTPKLLLYLSSDSAAKDVEGNGEVKLLADQIIQQVYKSSSGTINYAGSFTSEDPVNMTIKGTASSYPDCPCPINGKITLIKDGEGLGHILSSRASLTTGGLWAKGGTLQLNSGATFKNISKLTVGAEGVTGAALTIASGVTESPFGDSIAEVSLYDGSLISSESLAVTVTTTDFKVNGAAVAAYGDYTASDYPNAIGQNVTIHYQPAIKSCYVDAVGGSDDNSGLAEGAAKKTLSALFSTVTINSGDTVWVKPGTYDSGWQLDSSNECARVIVPDGVTLRSTDGKDTTIIEGAATGGGDEGTDPIRCVRMTGATSRLIGFTLRNGKGTYGGGVAAYVCDDETGKWSRGGLVADCSIIGCTGHGSGCVYANVVRTLFKDCGKSGSNTGVAGRNVRCYNCVFDGNGTSSTNYDLYNDSVAVNCTFVNGSAKAVRKIKNVKNCLILRENGVHDDNVFYRTYINREWNGSDNTFNDECQSTADNASLATGLRVKANYAPVRSNLGIGQGNVEYINDDYPTALDYLENGYNYDYYQHPRTTDGKVDLGAVENSGFPTQGLLLIFR